MDQSNFSNYSSGSDSRPETPRGSVASGSSTFGSPLGLAISTNTNSTLYLSDDEFEAKQVAELGDMVADLDAIYDDSPRPASEPSGSTHTDFPEGSPFLEGDTGGVSQDEVRSNWPLPSSGNGTPFNQKTTKSSLHGLRQKVTSKVSMPGLRRMARLNMGRKSNVTSEATDNGDDDDRSGISKPTSGEQDPAFEDLIRVLSGTKEGQAALYARTESQKRDPKLAPIGTSSALSSVTSELAGEEPLGGGHDGDETGSVFVTLPDDLLTDISASGEPASSALSAIPSTPWTIDRDASGVSSTGKLTLQWIPGSQGGPQAPRSEGDQSDATTIRPPGSSTSGEEQAGPDGLFPDDDDIGLITSGMGGAAL